MPDPEQYYQYAIYLCLPYIEFIINELENLEERFLVHKSISKSFVLF